MSISLSYHLQPSLLYRSWDSKSLLHFIGKGALIPDPPGQVCVLRRLLQRAKTIGTKPQAQRPKTRSHTNHKGVEASHGNLPSFRQNHRQKQRTFRRCRSRRRHAHKPLGRINPRLQPERLDRTHGNPSAGTRAGGI